MHTFEESLKHLTRARFSITIEDDRFVEFTSDVMSSSFYIDLELGTCTDFSSGDLDAVSLYHSLNLIMDLKDSSKDMCDELFERCEKLSPGYIKRTYTKEYTLEDLKND